MYDNVNITDDPFDLAKQCELGDIHIKYDEASGLKAIIAIHSTTLGPSLGGCRFVSYPSSQHAIYDAMRLAQGMSYKSAIAGLAHGGGKAVIIRPDESFDRKKLFESFGQFVDQLGGRYITAVDSGTNVDDMNVIATQTRYVRSTSSGFLPTGDPSPFTAFGVRRAIEAAVKTRFNKDDLQDVHVVIQGVGHVGYYLAKELHHLGARLTCADIDEAALERVKNEFSCNVVDTDKVFDVVCDVFSPCALGGAINENTIDRLQTHVIAGAANNQLASLELGQRLHEMKILYAPDYVANAGGLIQVSCTNKDEIHEKVSEIYFTLRDIFTKAKNADISPAFMADQVAKEIICNAELTETDILKEAEVS